MEFESMPRDPNPTAPAVGITEPMIDHWLDLFAQPADDMCPPDAAALFIDQARRIAQSLELGVALHRRQMLGPGERLRGDCRPGHLSTAARHSDGLDRHGV